VKAPTTEVGRVRGRAKKQASMLAFIDPETLIPADHSLRTIKRFADAALAELSPLFDEMYAADGRGRYGAHTDPSGSDRRLGTDVFVLVEPQRQRPRCSHVHSARMMTGAVTKATAGAALD